ncbi:COX15/CtaA family protein [Notoacmeibacter sp. MSK16QG-6]|uniref:COX15/CtaA family protein n=1 Tax=Notoacmeibacter sp. MSK16QG-6 TaxID=2957982 RepID=UPI00209E2536|nr:COX15/CtaA family protein [Notoacmeibacter sp. MSK16QG-6]MCP1198438.1 COX15/CtaA family protein [Notoacmeibacter sp. MSK16QG-6]
MAAIPASFSDFDPVAATRREDRNRRQIRVWLYLVLLLIFALVLVGGATRLTDSGLSITEWKPIHGVVPPMNSAEWREEFEKYKQIPEYTQINAGMTLSEFKTIFWWEWAHRLLARGVGFVFAVGLIGFWALGKIERRVLPRLIGILLLGGLQGAIGWWMVASGLTERTDVSQYRLAIHLTTACLIFTATMAVARGLAPHSGGPSTRGFQIGAGLIVLLLLIQIFIGGLVAGLDAGLAYNTWPRMDGAWIPSGLDTLEPAWRNLFENPKAVQFVHRIGAYVVAGAVIWHAIAGFAGGNTTHARRAAILVLLVAAQMVIGILTLLWAVPLHAALTHQGLAIVVLGWATAHWRGTKGAYPPQTRVEVQSYGNGWATAQGV